MKTWRTAVKSHKYVTNWVPVFFTILRKPARIGGAKAKARRFDLIISVMNSFGVCLLNPNFSSRTKVWYTFAGRDSACWIRMNVRTKTIECEISPVNPAGAKRRRPPVQDHSFGRTSKWMKAIFWIWPQRPRTNPNLAFARPYSWLLS